MEPFSYQVTIIYVNLKLSTVTVLGKVNSVSMWVSYSLSNMKHYAHVTYYKVIQGSEAFIRIISVTDDKQSIYNNNLQPCKCIRIAGAILKTIKDQTLSKINYLLQDYKCLHYISISPTSKALILLAFWHLWSIIKTSYL